MSFCLFLTWVIGGVRAQQKPQFTQYIYNNYLINPALTGIEEYTDLRMGLRDQWTGISDGPKTFFFSIQGPLGNLNHLLSPTTFSSSPEGVESEKDFETMKPHHGLGLMAIGDKTGPFTQVNLDLSYAYHLTLTNSSTLAFGLSAGIYQFSLNASSLSLPNSGIDPLVKSYTKYIPDLNFGLWYYTSHYYLGASLTNIIPGIISSSPSIQIPSHYRNYFISSGYKFYISRDISLLPSFLLKVLSPDPSSLDFGLKASYRDRIWLGASIRNQDSFSILAGVNVNTYFNFGYSYDYTTSALASYVGGTHEIFLGFLIHNIHHALCPRNVW